jgi:hypothetical protein
MSETMGCANGRKYDRWRRILIFARLFEGESLKMAALLDPGDDAARAAGARCDQMVSLDRKGRSSNSEG